MDANRIGAATDDAIVVGVKVAHAGDAVETFTVEGVEDADDDAAATAAAILAFFLLSRSRRRNFLRRLSILANSAFMRLYVFRKSFIFLRNINIL